MTANCQRPAIEDVSMPWATGLGSTKTAYLESVNEYAFFFCLGLFYNTAFDFVLHFSLLPSEGDWSPPSIW